MSITQQEKIRPQICRSNSSFILIAKQNRRNHQQDRVISLIRLKFVISILNYCSHRSCSFKQQPYEIVRVSNSDQQSRNPQVIVMETIGERGEFEEIRENLGREEETYVHNFLFWKFFTRMVDNRNTIISDDDAKRTCIRFDSMCMYV